MLAETMTRSILTRVGIGFIAAGIAVGVAATLAGSTPSETAALIMIAAGLGLARQGVTLFVGGLGCAMIARTAPEIVIAVTMVAVGGCYLSRGPLVSANLPSRHQMRAVRGEKVE